jgi:hypothetical protein
VLFNRLPPLNARVARLTAQASLPEIHRVKALHVPLQEKLPDRRSEVADLSAVQGPVIVSIPERPRVEISDTVSPTAISKMENPAVEQNAAEQIPAKTRGDQMEAVFECALDRSFLNLKRAVAREIKTLLRASAPALDLGTCDRFRDRLLSELESAVDVTGPPPINDDRAVVERVASIVDETILPVRRELRDFGAKERQLRERRLADLRAFASSVTEFRASLKSVCDLTLQELEKQRCDDSAAREREAARVRANEARLFSLTTKQSELEQRMRKQREEFEAIEKAARQIEEGRSDLARAPIDGEYDRVIQREMEALIAEMRRGDPELDSVLADCSTQIGQVKDGILDEVLEMDAAERWAVSRLRSPIRRTPASRLNVRQTPATPSPKQSRRISKGDGSP